MTDTTILGLPLIAAAQAQKHITVNEALSRLDAVVHLTLQSRMQSAPPQFPADGDSYLVGTFAVDAWENQSGKIASFLNGAWVFVTPRVGWQAYVLDEALRLTCDGQFWFEDVLVRSPSSAAMRAEITERDISVTAGSGFDTGFMIGSNSVVFGVTGRVLEDLMGSLTAWSLGVDGSANRYGSGLGVSAGSFVTGLTGQPLTYYSPTVLRVTPEGGAFSGGLIRLSVHMLRFEVPDGV